MTQRLLNDIHARLASRRFLELRAAGRPGRIGVQAFDETLPDATRVYHALPLWRRILGGTLPLDEKE